MEKVETCLECLMKRQPEIALHLLQVEKKPFQTPFSNENWDLSLSSCWWIDGCQADEECKKWLLKQLDHRLFLVFADIGSMRGWIEESRHALELVLAPTVTFICLKGPGSLNLSQLRQYIWSNPGFDVEYWDPLHRFSAFFDACRPLVFQRKAAIHEMMKFGAWNWPHILRRALSISKEKRLPQSLDWQHIPVCIVGAGVSVSEEIHYLGQIKQHALMLSAGTAINVLEALGHSPHIALTIDPFRAQYSRFSQVAAIETPVAAGWRSHYQALDCMKGPRILVPGSTAYPLTAFWQQQVGYECRLLEEGPNVVTTAMSMASYLGASQLFLLGVDLCLREKKLYGAGVQSTEAFYQPPEFQQDEVIQSLGDSGDVSTYGKWLAEAQWMSEFAQQTQIDIFRNKTEHLQIPHTLSVETSKWLESLTARDYEGWFWAWMQSLENVYTENENELLGGLFDQIEASFKWLENQKEELENLLAVHDISHVKGPSGQKAFLDLPAQVECFVELFHSDFQDMELYGLVFEAWSVCFDRVYKTSFEVLRNGKENLLWLDAWLLLRKIYFLISAVQNFRTWIEEVKQGQFLSEVEGV